MGLAESEVIQMLVSAKTARETALNVMRAKNAALEKSVETFVDGELAIAIKKEYDNGKFYLTYTLNPTADYFTELKKQLKRRGYIVTFNAKAQHIMVGW